MTPADVRELVKELQGWAWQWEQVHGVVSPTQTGPKLLREAATALESLLADRERLDWLQGTQAEHGNWWRPVLGRKFQGETLRAAIDAAREGER